MTNDTKREVTDEMVRVALKVFTSYHTIDQPDEACLFCMRKALEAVFNG